MPEGFALGDIFSIAVLLLAAYIHGAAGFGFPLVATPLLVLSMDLRSAILLTLLPTIAINLVSIVSEPRWREALRRFWPIPLFTLVGSVLGTQVLLSVDPETQREAEQRDERSADRGNRRDLETLEAGMPPVGRVVHGRGAAAGAAASSHSRQTPGRKPSPGGLASSRRSSPRSP